MKARSTLKRELAEVSGALARVGLDPAKEQRLKDIRQTLRWVLEGRNARRYQGWCNPTALVLPTRSRRVVNS